MEDATLVQKADSQLVLRSLASNESFPLSGEMLVGREVECAITLDSGHISRYHSKISVSPNGIFIEDLKSTNGTYVNGQRITQRTRIGLGDEVSFHRISFRIVSAESGDADATLMGGQFSGTMPKLSATDTNPQIRTGNATLEAPAKEQTPAVEPAEDNTQMLSATQLNRLVDRSKHAQKDIQVGSGARLVMLTAPLRGKVFSLDEAPIGSKWQIGRDPTLDICINDKTISNHHAQLSKVANGYLLSATEAKNGLIVNGRSEDRVFLSHNDKIQMGRMELSFKDDKSAKVKPIVMQEEGDAISAQIRNTRRMVLAALVTLIALASAVAMNLLD